MANEYRFILKGTLFTLVQTRNMFVARVNILSGEELADIGSEWLHDILDPIESILHSSVAFQTFEIQQWVSPSWIPLEEATFTFAGSGVGNAMPNESAAVMIGKTAGRRGIGKKFLSGFLMSAIDANSFGVSALSVLGASLIAWITPFETVGGSEVIPLLQLKDGTFRQFVGGYVASLVGSIRRRKPGLGI